MSLISISKIRKPNDTPYKLIRRIWGLESRERITSLRIVSAYTDLDWIEKVIDEFGKDRKFECVLDYGASGYNRDKETTEKFNKLAGRVSRKFKDGSGIYLARIGKFFHSKLLIARTSKKRNLGAVGSLNFTRRGFCDNEEIMYAVNHPQSLLEYSNEILENAGKIPLNKGRIPRDTTTYHDWMLAGSIFYEDKESNPFNFRLGIPDELRTQNSNVIPGEQAQTSDYYPLTKLLGIVPSRKQSWKKFCIATCYGHWCPAQLVNQTNEEIRNGVDQQLITKIQPILDNQNRLRDKYRELFSNIESNIKRIGIGQNMQWSRTAAETRLDDWLPRVINKLQDEAVRWRLLAGVSGPVVVPNFWASDNLALQEFEQSFCSHIVIELSKKRCTNKIAQWLWELDYSGFAPFHSDDWEEVWYDEDIWLEWLHQQSNDPFEGVDCEA